MAERPGRQSEGELAVTATAVDDDLDELLQINLCLLYLLTFALRGVCVHEGQADIALGHDERLTALQRDALSRQLLGQHCHGQSRAVAAGAEGVGVDVGWMM